MTWTEEEEQRVLRHFAMERLDAAEWMDFGAEQLAPGIGVLEAVADDSAAAQTAANEQLDNLLAINFQDAFSDPLGLNDDIYRYSLDKSAMIGVKMTDYRKGGVPPELSVQVTTPQFQVDAFLRTVHAGTLFEDLQKALPRLKSKIGAIDELQRQLVRDNFDRFVSAKATIDRLFVDMQSQGLTDPGGDYGLKRCMDAVSALRKRVLDLFSPLLQQRQVELDLRRKLSFLDTHAWLFRAPQRLQSLMVLNDWTEAVREAVAVRARLDAVVKETRGLTGSATHIGSDTRSVTSLASLPSHSQSAHNHNISRDEDLREARCRLMLPFYEYNVKPVVRELMAKLATLLGLPMRTVAEAARLVHLYDQLLPLCFDNAHSSDADDKEQPNGRDQAHDSDGKDRPDDSASSGLDLFIRLQGTSTINALERLMDPMTTAFDVSLSASFSGAPALASLTPPMVPEELLRESLKAVASGDYATLLNDSGLARTLQGRMNRLGELNRVLQSWRHAVYPLSHQSSSHYHAQVITAIRTALDSLASLLPKHADQAGDAQEDNAEPGRDISTSHQVSSVLAGYYGTQMLVELGQGPLGTVRTLSADLLLPLGRRLVEQLWADHLMAEMRLLTQFGNISMTDSTKDHASSLLSEPLRMLVHNARQCSQYVKVALEELFQ
jgi:hypothetical protein